MLRVAACAEEKRALPTLREAGVRSQHKTRLAPISFLFGQDPVHLRAPKTDLALIIHAHAADLVPAQPTRPQTMDAINRAAAAAFVAPKLVAIRAASTKTSACAGTARRRLHYARNGRRLERINPPGHKLGAFGRHDAGENMHPDENDLVRSKDPLRPAFPLPLPSVFTAHPNFQDHAIRQLTREKGLRPSIFECRLEPGRHVNPGDGELMPAGLVARLYKHACLQDVAQGVPPCPVKGPVGRRGKSSHSRLRECGVFVVQMNLLGLIGTAAPR